MPRQKCRTLLGLIPLGICISRNLNFCQSTKYDGSQYGLLIKIQNTFEHAEKFSFMEPASISLRVIKIHNQLCGKKTKERHKEKENKVSRATYPQDKHLTRKNEMYICMQKHLGSQECLVDSLRTARRRVTRGRSTLNPTSSSFKYQERDIRGQAGRKGDGRAGKEDTG